MENKSQRNKVCVSEHRITIKISTKPFKSLNDAQSIEQHPEHATQLFSTIFLKPPSTQTKHHMQGKSLSLCMHETDSIVE